MSNELLHEAVKELKEDQKETLKKVESLNEKFYNILKEHMDKEDIRWELVLRELAELKIEQTRIREATKLNSSILSKVWVIAAPVITAMVVSIVMGNLG